MSEPCICFTCSSFNGKMMERCKDGFLSATYPTGIPPCLRDDPGKNLIQYPDYQRIALQELRGKP